MDASACKEILLPPKNGGIRMTKVEFVIMMQNKESQNRE